MCSYIVETAKLMGSAKGAAGWMRVDTAHVYFDHPFHAPLDHALGIDLTCQADGGRERVALELSAESARALVDAILAALASGEEAHSHDGADSHTHAEAAEPTAIRRPSNAATLRHCPRGSRESAFCCRKPPGFEACG